MHSLVLGIETSCDETAAAVVRAGSEVLSNVISSQVAAHAAFGGVVPEIASREHLRNIVPVVREAIAQAGISLDDVEAIAVTEGPGLAGALLVGIAYAKALAFTLGKPLIAVNHLEGHIVSALMQQEVESPALALVVSGGHTHLYLAEREGPAWRYRNVGRTVDDAAGEAFDKVAKLLGLGYPGGPWISALAAHGNPLAVKFGFAQVKPKAHRGQSSLPENFTYFSFSGIKTAVARYVELNGMETAIAARRAQLGSLTKPDIIAALPLCNKQTLDLIASFQHAVVENLVRRTLESAERHNAQSVVISGGVAANRLLRERFTEQAARGGLAVHFPAAALNTDNAAMIAAAAWQKFAAGDAQDPRMTAQPSLALGAIAT